jgi:hypothetical protein
MHLEAQRTLEYQPVSPDDLNNPIPAVKNSRGGYDRI